MNDDGTYTLDWDEVHRHGYMEFGCDDCAEIIYRGPLLQHGADATLIEMHSLLCAKPLSSMRKQRRSRRLLDWFGTGN